VVYPRLFPLPSRLGVRPGGWRVFQDGGGHCDLYTTSATEDGRRLSLLTVCGVLVTYRFDYGKTRAWSGPSLSLGP